MKISIKKISELSGVSVATVSRIINKKGKYSKQTEEKVLKIIQEQHYIPNLIARSLRTKTTSIVGIIVPDITNEYFAKIVLHIQKELFLKNYSTIICNTDEQLQLERQHLDILSAQNVSGIIMVGQPAHGSKKNKIPCVYIDRKPRVSNAKDYVLIISDNIRGGYLAGKELIQKGCKKIATIMDMREYALGHERYKGFCLSLEEYSIPQNDELLFPIQTVNFQNGEMAMKQLLTQHPDIDGVFCYTDWVALGAIKAIQDMSFLVPRDIKVVGFDDISVSELAQIPLTTVHQNTSQMAKEAVDALIHLIQKIEVKQPIKKLPVKLIQRATT